MPSLNRKHAIVAVAAFATLGAGYMLLGRGSSEAPSATPSAQDRPVRPTAAPDPGPRIRPNTTPTPDPPKPQKIRDHRQDKPTIVRPPRPRGAKDVEKPRPRKQLPRG